MKEKRYFENDFVFDLETYKNIFTFCIIRSDGKFLKVFEVSDRKDQTEEILNCLRYLKKNNCRMVGFNNLGFDYPILHEIMLKAISAKKLGRTFKLTSKYCYDLAQDQINSFKFNGFGNTIQTKDRFIEQVDLFKIHHFDNKAKATSLKMIEYNMRSETIEDLPFHHSEILNSDQMDVLIEYNKHDVLKTLEFYYESYDAISFRKILGEKLGIDFTNHNDGKIGGDYFIQKLEKNKPGSCYKYVNGKRKLNRSPRESIDLNECLFDYYDFKEPAFEAIRKWFSNQVITETKGVFTDIPEHKLGDVAKYAELTKKKKRFKGVPTEKDIADFKKQYPLGEIEVQELKATEYLLDENGDNVLEYPKLENGQDDTSKKKVKVRVPKKSYWMTWNIASNLNVVVDGLRYDFGVGGLHASVTSTIVDHSEEEMIKDADVSSMYPNLSIRNEVYPEHLGKSFCSVYENVYVQRSSYAKGTPENAVMKLALNVTYGNSNNEFSPFYDPKFTMTITINGQLSILLLVDRLLAGIPDIQIVQVNTDGVTCKFNKEYSEKYNKICQRWEKDTKLTLEFVEYDKMFVRDCNNYIAKGVDGKIKRKGAYQYEDLGWHQNQSSLVIPKAVEAFLVNGVKIEDFIKNHDDPFDFMLRTKVPRSSKLVMVTQDEFEIPLQNICRYYPCKAGGKLVKLMPPTAKQVSEGKSEDRRIGIDKAWNVRSCNNMKDFQNDIDYDYYIQEAEKLASLAIPDEIEDSSSEESQENS